MSTKDVQKVLYFDESKCKYVGEIYQDTQASSAL